MVLLMYILSKIDQPVLFDAVVISKGFDEINKQNNIWRRDLCAGFVLLVVIFYHQEHQGNTPRALRVSHSIYPNAIILSII